MTTVKLRKETGKSPSGSSFYFGMGRDLREVRFDLYCETCKHKNLNETDEPCCECLEETFNENTAKPVKWEGKNEQR